MSSRLLDDRTFESAVEHDSEQAAASAAYFKDKGYAVSVEEVDDLGNKKPAETPVETTTAVADKADAEPVLVDGKPVEEDILAEYQADTSEKNDGERLGRHARRTRELKELREKVAAETAKREELEQLLAAKPAADAKASAFQPVPVAAPVLPVQVGPAVTTPVEEIKPKTFDKPRPVRPTIDKFQDEPDPYASFAAAGVQYAEDLSDWKDEKGQFERTQEAEVSKNTREVEEKRTRQTEFQSALNQRFEDVRKARPDFDMVTKDKQVPPILTFLLVGFPDTGLEATLPDGLELAYQLSLPENAETFKEIVAIAATEKGEDARTVQAKIDMARAELVAFRKDLKRKAASAPVTTDKVVEPVVAAVAPANGKVVTEQTPSNGQPRREEASPTTVRGRGVAPGVRPEDIDPMDSDARRRVRKQLGQM